MERSQERRFRDQFSLFCDILRAQEGITILVANHQMMHLGDIRLELLIQKYQWQKLERCLCRARAQTDAILLCGAKTSQRCPGRKEVSIAIECDEKAVADYFRPFVCEVISGFTANSAQQNKTRAKILSVRPDPNNLSHTKSYYAKQAA